MAEQQRLRPLKSRRVGRGKNSYLRFEALLTPLQQTRVQGFVVQPAVQSQLFGVGTVGSSSRKDRDSRIALLGRPGSFLEPEIPPWLDRKLRKAVLQTHSILGDGVCPLGIDSSGRCTPRYEPVQYAEYGRGGHYAAWHTDADVDESELVDLRCVTVVLMVSNAGAYEGGELEVRLGAGRVAARVRLRAGDAVAFPSKHLAHRVAKCRSGLRQTLVFWARRPGAEPRPSCG